VRNGWGIMAVLGVDTVQGVDLKKCTAVFDQTGRFSPSYDETQRETIDCDVIIVAIGMGPDIATFRQSLPAATGVRSRSTARLCSPRCPTCLPAAMRSRRNDDHHGHRPGRRASYMIAAGCKTSPSRRWLRPAPSPGASEEVLRRQASHSRKEPCSPERRLPASLRTFARSSRP